MGCDRLRGPGDLRPKSVRRWLTCSLLANGIDPDGLTHEDMIDTVCILLATRRTIKPADWMNLGRAGDASELLDMFGAF